jgi:hypothetical protein
VQLPRATRLLLGFSGPREEAEQIKQRLQEFLQETLKLELSQEKTLLTHARTEAARFLGYEIVTLDADCKHDHRGQRCINGAPGLKVPAAVICKKRTSVSSRSIRRNTGASCNTTCWPSTSIAYGNSTGLWSFR